MGVPFHCWGSHSPPVMIGGEGVHTTPQIQASSTPTSSADPSSPPGPLSPLRCRHCLGPVHCGQGILSNHVSRHKCQVSWWAGDCHVPGAEGYAG